MSEPERENDPVRENGPVRGRLTSVRRAFHHHPEPAWREFHTTSLIVDELERIEVDDVAIGADALATYAIVGTDHPNGHHTPTFDVDERSLAIGVDVLTESVLHIADEDPNQ